MTMKHEDIQRLAPQVATLANWMTINAETLPHEINLAIMDIVIYILDEATQAANVAMGIVHDMKATAATTER